MLTESISIKSAVLFYQLAITMMNGGSGVEFHKFADSLIGSNNLEYIERKEYWGEKPRLVNLSQLQIADECSAHNIIEKFMSNIPEITWGILNEKENSYIRYELPYYQRINKCLIPYKTRIVNINFGNEHDYIIAVPTDDQEEWQQWKLAIDKKSIKLNFYPAFDEKQVIEDLNKNLSSLVK